MVAPNDQHYEQAFAQAGSSVFTLGYAAPQGVSLSVIDGAVALAIGGHAGCEVVAAGLRSEAVSEFVECDAYPVTSG